MSEATALSEDGGWVYFSRSSFLLSFFFILSDVTEEQEMHGRVCAESAAFGVVAWAPF